LLTSRRSRWGLRTIALGYLALLLLAPVAVVFVKTFEHGFGVAWGWMTTPAAVSALWLSIVMALIAVPLNTIFGISTALVLVRGRAAHPRLTGLLDTLIDLPFLVSPVIIGLALTLVYGIHGWFGSWFAARGVQIIFAPAGMVLATVFVSLPFVVREVVPVLVEIGDDQEQAASTLGASRWQTFRRITLPSIRWGVAYGVILSTARALGEIGAVLVVSSLVAGQTLSLPLLVYQRAMDIGAASTTGDYAAATELAVISLVVLLVMTILSPRRDTST
jgi:sulfate transport system permease protein